MGLFSAWHCFLSKTNAKHPFGIRGGKGKVSWGIVQMRGSSWQVGSSGSHSEKEANPAKGYYHFLPETKRRRGNPGGSCPHGLPPLNIVLLLSTSVLAFPSLSAKFSSEVAADRGQSCRRSREILKRIPTLREETPFLLIL